MEVITSAERELAAKITDHAMIAGWQTAAKACGKEYNYSLEFIFDLLDKALEYNSKADPSGRIEGIEDWRIEKLGRSERARARP